MATWGLGLYQNQVYLAYINNPFCVPFCSYWPGMKMLTWNNLCHLKVENVSATDGLAISPNPANDVILISGLAGNDPIKVYDVIGHEVICPKRRSGNSVSVDIKALASGLYIVKYKSSAVRFLKN